MPGLLALVLLDIILRNLFTATLSWSHEVLGLALLCIFFLDLPYCLAKNELLKVDLIYNYFSQKLKIITNLVIWLCCLGLSVFMVWQAVIGLRDMYEFEEQAYTLQMPLWPFAGMVAVSASLMVLQSLSSLLTIWTKTGLKNE